MEPIKKLKTESNSKQKGWRWEEEDGIIWGKSSDFIGGDKLAMFDMDGTLITTKRGSGFARSSKDWKFFDEIIPEKLQEYSKKGYTFVIASNQKGISQGKPTPSEIKTKIEDFCSKLNVPICALLATQDDHYRKPMTGMWEFYSDTLNDGEEINKKESFYVGDAAGRKKTKERKNNDFSDSDRMFAINVGIDFFTPEMFFLDSKESLPSLPKSLFEIFSKNKEIFDGKEYKFDSTQQHGKKLS